MIWWYRLALFCSDSYEFRTLLSVLWSSWFNYFLKICNFMIPHSVVWWFLVFHIHVSNLFTRIMFVRQLSSMTRFRCLVGKIRFGIWVIVSKEIIAYDLHSIANCLCSIRALTDDNLLSLLWISWFIISHFSRFFNFMVVLGLSLYTCIGSIYRNFVFSTNVFQDDNFDLDAV